MSEKKKISPVELDVPSEISQTVLEEAESRFLPKKVMSVYLSGIYKYLADNPSIQCNQSISKLIKRSESVGNCANYITFAVNTSDPTDRRLQNVFFCKDRLCSMCNWRRTLKLGYQNSIVMNEAQKRGYQFIFITLTVPNCSGEDLDSTCDKLMAGYRFLYNKNKRFRTISKGSITTLEITYNRKTNTFHPHLHLIVAVNKSYFGSRDYMTHKELTNIWSDYMNLGRTLIVNIKRVQPTEKNKSLAKAIKEISKYAVKGTDFYFGGNIEESAPVVAFLSDTLRKRRLVNRTGVLKKIHKEMNLEDVESDDANLLNVNDSSMRDDVAYAIIRLHWKYGCYIEE